MKKRMISLLLVMAMAATGFVGCGNENSNDNSGVDGSDVNVGETVNEIVFPLEETMTFSMFGVQGDAQYDMYAEGGAFDLLCKNANIKFDLTRSLTSEFGVKKLMLINSGTYPDVYFKADFTPGQLAKYSSQGILIPLEDLIRNYAPNMTKYLDEHNYWQYIEDNEGHIYSLYEMGKPGLAVTGLWINTRWLKNVGMDMPTDTESLYAVLKAFKDKDANGNGDPNDEIPLTADMTVTINCLLPFFLNEFTLDGMYVDADGTYKYAYTSEAYKEFLKFLTKLHSEGILDSNCFTADHDVNASVGKSGDIHGAFFNAAPWLQVGDDNDDEYQLVPSFEGCTRVVTSGIVNTCGTMVITDKCEHPEVVIAWADQLYNEEGGILAWLGVEGVNYVKDENGNYTWTDGEQAGTVPGIIQGYQHHPSIQPDYYFDGMSDPEDLHTNTELDKILAEETTIRPATQFSETEEKQLNTITVQLNDYMKQYQALVVTGKQDLDSTWEEYLKNMESMGASQYETLYRTAYERNSK